MPVVNSLNKGSNGEIRITYCKLFHALWSDSELCQLFKLFSSWFTMDHPPSSQTKNLNFMRDPCLGLVHQYVPRQQQVERVLRGIGQEADREEHRDWDIFVVAAAPCWWKTKLTVVQIIHFILFFLLKKNWTKTLTFFNPPTKGVTMPVVLPHRLLS